MLKSQQSQPFESISTDLLALIFSYLEIKDVLSFLRTSKSTYGLLKDTGFLQSFLNNQKSFKIHNIRITQDIATTFFNEVFKHLYTITDKSKDEVVPWLPLDASSTDKNEAIYLTLDGRDGFWGTVGYQNENEVLTAVFDLGEGCKTILKEVEIVFTHLDYVYVNGQVIGSPIYQSKTIQVELGFHPDKPIYTSQEVPVKSTVQRNEELSVVVPIYPEVVFARYVKVKFIGMQSRFTLKDNLFYLCVDFIIPRGRRITGISGETLDKSLSIYYNDQKNKNVNSQQIQEEQYENIYINDMTSYNKHKFEELDKLFAEKKTKEIENLLEKNPQFKSDKNFIIYLMKNSEIADIYFEYVFSKQNYLNSLETILMLNLTIDIEKLLSRNQNGIIKNDKYQQMFWLYCYDSDAIQGYLENLFSKGIEEAAQDLNDETVDSVESIEFHHGFDLQKIFWSVAVSHGNIDAHGGNGGMMYDEDSDY